MRRRLAATLVRRRLREVPAVALVGPRQAGKTTLAKALGGRYFDLQQDEERLRLDLEWSALVAGRELVVLDEAQEMPAIFRRLRGAIDADRRRHARFLLLGSVSPALMREVGESLAGRLSVVELSPLAWGEVPPAQHEALWHLGGFPDGGVLGGAAFPRWQHDYVTLLAQRDLPAWGLSARPAVTARLLRMLAAVHGQAWNASRLGESMGLSYHTIDSYLAYLEGAFLVRRLAPWHGNVAKRLVKSPKVYLRDSGVLHALLGIRTRRDLLAHPSVGASWEGFVIEQVLATLAARGEAATTSFFRTSDGIEVDLVLDRGKERVAVEIKLTTAPGSDDFARLERAADLAGATRRALVSRSRTRTATRERFAGPLGDFLRWLA